MKINKDFDTVNLKSFKDIPVGDFFVYHSKIYLKVRSDDSSKDNANAIEIPQYLGCNFDDRAEVEPLYAELTLSKNPIVNVEKNWLKEYPWINPVPQVTPLPNNPYWDVEYTGKPIQEYCTSSTTVYCEGVCND
jgi:hypothetical protein